MRNSVVIETDAEVKARMKADMAKASDIDAELTARKANADAVQAAYDKPPGSQSDTSSQQQNQ